MLHFHGKMAHYHDFATHNGEITQVSTALQCRFEDIAEHCTVLSSRSVVDIGSYYGGLCFLLEATGRFEAITGIEKRKEFFDIAQYYKESISSKVEFANIDFIDFHQDVYDVAIVQNVYHYLFGEAGSHLVVFQHLARIAKNIIWYNPISMEDIMVQKYASKQDTTDFKKYNLYEIVQAAKTAGFSVKEDKRSRYDGMGAYRQHLTFHICS